MELTETERAELNARLARAMGIADDRWTFQCLKDNHLLDGHGPHAFCLTCVAPVSKSALVPPDFTRSAEASRELLLWVVAQDHGIDDSFVAHLVAKLEEVRGSFEMGRGAFYAYEVLALMTASPLLIAIAADAATGGKDGR